MTDLYRRAQIAVVELKACIHQLLEGAGAEGIRNVDVGRMLGIYGGHEGHVGHVPRTLLALMQEEGTVEQVQGTKQWRLVTIASGTSNLGTP